MTKFRSVVDAIEQDCLMNTLNNSENPSEVVGGERVATNMAVSDWNSRLLSTQFFGSQDTKTWLMDKPLSPTKLIVNFSPSLFLDTPSNYSLNIVRYNISIEILLHSLYFIKYFSTPLLLQILLNTTFNFFSYTSPHLNWPHHISKTVTKAEHNHWS